MKPSLIISAIFIMIFTAGCIDNKACCDLPDSHIFYVNLLTEDGNSLLNNQSDEAIDLSKTRLYLIENGFPKMFEFESSGILHNRYGVAPVNINDMPTAQISFIYSEDKTEIEGFIQWNKDLADTLNFTLNSTERPTYISKISQRGKILWDVETDPNKEPFINLEH